MHESAELESVSEEPRVRLLSLADGTDWTERWKL
jgi:hypothetical protein